MRRKFVTKRRPTKTTARECETRGGEYTAYDRASRASSLKVWMDTARGGDAKAQYYVGEIYEKGYDRLPDYQQALLWYSRAAEQNYAPAMIAVGLLYEEGRGVKKDLVQAMNWYRRSEGLKSYESAYTAAFDTLKKDVLTEREKLKKFKTVTDETLTVLGTEMGQTDDALRKAQLSISHQKNLVAALRKKLELTGDDSSVQQQLSATESSLARKEKARQMLTSAQQETRAAYSEIQRGVQQQSRQELRIAVRLPAMEPSTRGTRTADVNPGSAVQVVGAVIPVEQLESLTVNGQQSDVDQLGLFAVNINMGDRPQPVTVRARGLNGKTSEYNFTLQPRSPAPGTDFSADELSTDEFGRFYALVVGNNNYNTTGGWPKLKTAVNDATAVADLLHDKFGVKVTLLTDATRRGFLLALQKMRQTLTEKDNFILYYAGHGWEDPENGKGYWIPVDADTDSTVDFIPNSTLTEQIQAMNVLNVLVISDSCYSASLTRSGIVNVRSGMSPARKRAKLRRDIKTPTRMVLAAGGMQPVADSLGKDEHSVFTQALLETLRADEGIVDGDSVAVKVGQKVAVKAEKYEMNQVPRYAPLAHGGHVGGEFYFVERR